MTTVAIAYREDAEIVAQIDRLVIARRRNHPEGLFSRAQFIREAVKKVLEDLPASSANMQIRTRERCGAAA